MATPMLQARAALRIIDRMDKLTKERLVSSVQQNEAAPLADSEPAASESRRLDRPPSHTAVDIPELATLDSAQVSQATSHLVCMCTLSHCMKRHKTGTTAAGNSLLIKACAAVV